MKQLLCFLLLFSFLILSGSPLIITGNVEQGTMLENPGNLSVLLSDLSIESEALLIIGNDGTAAYVEYSAIKWIELVFADSVWLTKALELPPVCSIKDIAEIAIFQSFWPATLLLPAGETYTPFSFMMKGFRIEATAQKNGYTAVKYISSQKNLLPCPGSNVSLFYKNGSSESVKFSPELFEFNGCEFYYQKEILRRIEGN